MFRTIPILIIAIVCMGCAGISGTSAPGGFLNQPAATSQSASNSDMDGYEEDSEGDPGSGSGHPSLGELGSADSEGGTTDEVPDPLSNIIKFQGSDDDEDDSEDEDDEDDDIIGSKSGTQIGIYFDDEWDEDL